METSHFLQYAVMFLAAAVVAVSISRRYGLGAVLGYLAAGALIGPHLLNLTPDMHQASELSELGVNVAIYSTPCLFAAHEAMDLALGELKRTDGRLPAVDAGRGVGVKAATRLLERNMARRRSAPEGVGV